MVSETSNSNHQPQDEASASHIANINNNKDIRWHKVQGYESILPNNAQTLSKANFKFIGDLEIGNEWHVLFCSKNGDIRCIVVFEILNFNPVRGHELELVSADQVNAKYSNIYGFGRAPARFIHAEIPSSLKHLLKKII